MEYGFSFTLWRTLILGKCEVIVINRSEGDFVTESLEEFAFNFRL